MFIFLIQTKTGKYVVGESTVPAKTVAIYNTINYHTVKRVLGYKRKNKNRTKEIVFEKLKTMGVEVEMFVSPKQKELDKAKRKAQQKFDERVAAAVAKDD